MISLTCGEGHHLRGKAVKLTPAFQRLQTIIYPASHIFDEKIKLIITINQCVATGMIFVYERMLFIAGQGFSEQNNDKPLIGGIKNGR